VSFPLFSFYSTIFAQFGQFSVFRNPLVKNR